ncbi:serine/threonine-protein kinase [Sorangium cellulosum]|uniref:serine/threonine-protein kinase n=1 Tax=Sorangium cellulosum TaxID=56 RepID=UPI000CF5626A|nr:serine/threonine-protein kinase [Sorangium cellulosum]
MTSLKARGEDRAAPRERTDADRAPRANQGDPSGQEVVAGRYVVEARIGVGGIGVVQLATDRESGRRVALKRVDPRIAESRPAVDRLLRGARAARSLSGRYVARILDVGSDGAAPFIVAEYLEGCNATSYLQRRGPLRAREAVKYLLQVCEAVAEAHANELLHRDLKPENLFLSFGADGAPSVKVLDFGVSAIACGVESEGPGAATAGAMRGSLLYMAPEQMRSAGGIDERADIWSIGAIGYALVCGVSPFEATSEIEICSRVLNEPPAPIPARVEIGGLKAVLLQCLQKDPDDRFPDVAKLAYALVPFGADGADDAAERVWEVLRGDETVRMAKPTADPSMEDEWAPDTLADLPRMSPDDLMRDLESTAKWNAPDGNRVSSEITLVSHAGASWDGGEGLRPSRASGPEVVTVDAPALPAEPPARGKSQPDAGGRTPLPLDPRAAHRASLAAAEAASVEAAPSPWPRRLALALALLGLLAGLGGVWMLVQGSAEPAGRAVPAAKGVARRAARAASALAGAKRPVAPAPPVQDEPLAAPTATLPEAEPAAGPAGEPPPAAPSPGGFQGETGRPEAIYDEVERERRRREKIERERRWLEETERARKQRDEGKPPQPPPPQEPERVSPGEEGGRTQPQPPERAQPTEPAEGAPRPAGE